jgi:glycosyltransferase involved in cell wall biosynthesis
MGANASTSYVQVIDPIQIPSWRSRISRVINAARIRWHIEEWRRHWEGRVIGITALPLPPEWLERLPVDIWVYYCVDDFSQWPGLDGPILRKCEEVLVHRASIIVAVSDVLQKHINSLGRASYLLTHGIDLELWNNTAGLANSVEYNFPRPAVLWWGLIDERLDWDWIQYAAEQLCDVHFVFIGRAQFLPSRISVRSNVHLLGKVEPNVLPLIARRADALMMPYIDAPVTRAMQPLKMLEYLASGLPIVARQLPPLEKWRDHVYVVGNKQEFVGAIRKALATRISEEDLARRRECLKNETWAAKARQFLGWLRQGGLIN